MAGFFYVSGISSGITWDYLDSIVGVNLEFLGFFGFRLSSIWDSISDPFAFI